MERVSKYGCVATAIGIAVAASCATLNAAPGDEGRPSHTCELQSISAHIRQAAAAASESLVSVYTMRGPHETPAWRALEASRHEFPGGETHENGADYRRDDQGSGIILNQNGWVLTCHHVTASADVVFVVLADGTRHEPVEIRSDPSTDIALLRIATDERLQTAKLGESSHLEVGDWVVSLSNPYQLDRTVTTGVISATSRRLPGSSYSFLQSDAASSPGSSGGPLMNLHGEVVGIMAGGFGAAAEFPGVSLAIPIDTANQVVDRLLASVTARRPHVGLATKMLSPDISSRLGISTETGLYVEEVTKASAADDAGIEVGDIITRVQGNAVDQSFRMDDVLAAVDFAETLPVELIRRGKPRSLNVTLTKSAHTGQNTKLTEAPSRDIDAEFYDHRCEIGVSALEPSLRAALRVPPDTNGVIISDVPIKGRAYKEGIAEGMVVTRVNDREIHDLNDFESAVRDVADNLPILMLVKSGSHSHLVVFEDSR
ncbi:PDZ domain-containing protein [Aeoliella sp. ICT_H6.2]|uniref:PDZ domain-containing protein n=1 Tax=Aeoliella straminimaris TaxID=2954799 RepID=A0A9X2JE83_9BACT|nr:trypsin-like peptidase domain-containing protein [Aeoliella straminimaris]MCO6042730.1 PDZ domain-containing protein [Aeoliella straminimaris]